MTNPTTQLSKQFDQAKSRAALKFLYHQIKGMLEDDTTVNFSNTDNSINCQFLTNQGQISINVLEGVTA